MSVAPQELLRRLRDTVVDIDAGFAELRRTRTATLSAGSAFLYRAGRTTDLAMAPPSLRARGGGEQKRVPWLG